jgi:hypothetical protein
MLRPIISAILPYSYSLDRCWWVLPWRVLIRHLCGRFNAANIFEGSVKFGGSNLFSRILLGLQIVVSFITVIAGIAFLEILNFSAGTIMYDKENIIGWFTK